MNNDENVAQATFVCFHMLVPAVSAYGTKPPLRLYRQP